MTLLKKNHSEKQPPRETWLKGRMAESLVHDLLKESGNDVFRIGYESSLPQLAAVQSSFKKNDAVAKKLRFIPDLFVIDRAGHPHLVEVKFRWHHRGHEKDPELLMQLAHYWQEAVVIFVNCTQKPYFQFTLHPFLNAKGEIIFKALDRYMPLGVSEELMAEFDALVKKYLRPTLTQPLPKGSTVLDHPMQYL